MTRLAERIAASAGGARYAAEKNLRGDEGTKWASERNEPSGPCAARVS